MIWNERRGPVCLASSRWGRKAPEAVPGPAFEPPRLRPFPQRSEML